MIQTSTVTGFPASAPTKAPSKLVGKTPALGYVFELKNYIEVYLYSSDGIRGMHMAVVSAPTATKVQRSPVYAGSNKRS